ncbi:MAG: hypothetical protein Q4G51_01445 [Dermatophilus congolensis]|nr:hypothetical protein [Dermatophilus congolensis]
MATSKPWLRRVGDYLGSNRNIVGSVAGMAALGATVPTGVAGPLWPVVVGGVYGIAALLVPGERRASLEAAVAGNAELHAATMSRAEALRQELSELSASVRSREKGLPQDVLAAFGEVEGSLRDLLKRADDLVSSPDDLFVVARTIENYLPTAIDTYAELPRGFALTHRGVSGRTAHDELLNQLRMLDARLDEIETAIYAGDLAELTAQGDFLAQRFGTSSLDLDPPPQDDVSAPPDSRSTRGQAGFD